MTEGRRKEFSKFRAFSDPATREKIPDPQAESTFNNSKLVWDEVNNKGNIRHLDHRDHCLSRTNTNGGRQIQVTAIAQMESVKEDKRHKYAWPILASLKVSPNFVTGHVQTLKLYKALLQLRNTEPALATADKSSMEACAVDDQSIVLVRKQAIAGTIFNTSHLILE